MRKHQQHQILSLLQTIKRAQSLNLYADCLESAAGIGAFIDSVEGKGTQTVKLLADYCGLLSKACNNQVDGQQLRKYLAMIENSIRHELKPPDKIEVVFFPYNVSKFDSLESIYLAAKNDPQCNVYVVPIPYYNLLPDRSFGQLHYEGHLYPDNIPITAWQEYDVEARCPDIIFIHTPYDEDNLVTSIHPDFYSERLRNFTGLLVYIPYFVCVDDVPEWLCIHSGTVWSNKIIVQSEKVRQTYIRVFKEFGKKNNCEEILVNLDDKIIALGSPKFDKVLTTKREDCRLPDKWRALIERPDGTQKKIILYNTSLSSLLQGNAPYLKKVESVLALFHERDDVVLWWRPHPLSKNTYQAMRPHLLDEYEQIVAEYRDGGWGIYDDTPDLHRAICLSDGYFGDNSSLVALYQVTGKPLMLQNVNVLGSEDEEIEPKFFSIQKGRNSLWFTDDRYNGLFEISILDKSIKYLGKFSNENRCKILYRLSAFDALKNKLYFAPYNARNIAIYDISNKTFSYIPICEKCCDTAFFMPIIYGEYIYFTPYNQKAIMRLDTGTNSLDYYDDWMQAFHDGNNSVSDAYFLCPAVNGNKIMLASCKSNIVVEFDMDKNVSTCYKVGGSDYRYGGCCFDGENYWLTPRLATPLVKWHPTVGVIKEFAMDGFIPQSGKDILFHPAVLAGRFMWLFPRQADCVLKIDVYNDKMDIVESATYFQDGTKSPKNRYFSSLKSLFAQSFEEKIYVFDNKANQLIVSDCSQNKLDRWDLKYSASVCRKFLTANDDYLQSKGFIYLEINGIFTLSNFLNYVMDGDCQMSNKNLGEQPNRELDGIAGKKIYEFVKSLY